MTDQENSEWQAPPPPEKIVVDEPQMSEIATLVNIFIEPGRTFEDLKRKPRFIMAAVIVSLLITAYAFALNYKVGETGMRQFAVEQIDKSPQTSAMTAEQKSGAADMQMTIQSVMRYVMPVFVLISFVIGGLLYFAGAKAFGGSGGYIHALSVWVYSSLPPTVVGMFANFIVLAFKSVDDINVGASQRGVLNANPSFFIDPVAHPVIATALATFDVFFIWGWILAAIGLRITNKLSSGSAWGIVILLALVGIAFRLIGAIFSGNLT